MVRANSTHPITTEPRELDSRTSDGIHVQLLWHPLDGRVSVAINDTKTGEGFDLEVRHGQQALDVYHHPYAYAATNLPIAREGLPSSAGARG
ncbi:MAG: hypothetical protein JO304_02635 [Solirubrobacterales bacterium]|nr:hypothetical protein [Solirubrobacterales bacterium]